MKQDQAQAVLGNIMHTMDYDLVIAAATESIPLNQKIFDYNIMILPRIRDQIPEFPELPVNTVVPERHSRKRWGTPQGEQAST
jgi:hypothetical protein